MSEKIKSTVSFILEKVNFKPDTGIILGSGLGGLVKEMNVSSQIDYKEIPNFPVPTVDGHEGKLIFGTIGKRKVVAMQGRFHFYEGHPMEIITFPVRVMKMLGVETLFLSNASGGINPEFEVGDIMIINDHINLFPQHPLLGKNMDEFGPRFVDMSNAYDKQLIELAIKVAKENSITVKQGVYAGVSGPTYETPAEYMYIRKIGADAVGMSTVPEVIVARHMSMKCFAASIITDLGVPDKIKEITHHEVIDVAKTIEPKLSFIIKEIISTM